MKTAILRAGDPQTAPAAARILREGGLRLSLLLTKAGRWAEDFAAANPQFAGQVKVLQTILSGDYSSSARELAGEAEDGKADD